jgi:Flp pilus assembly protein TadG
MIHRTQNTPRRSGATVVEVSLVISACLLFMFGIFEYGRFVMTGQIMENAAREGNRYAAIHTGDVPPPDVAAYVKSYMAGQDVQLTGFTVNVYRADTAGNNLGTDWYNAAFGNGIATQITGVYKPVLPSFVFMNSSINMNTTSVMLSEGN